MNNGFIGSGGKPQLKSPTRPDATSAVTASGFFPILDTKRKEVLDSRDVSGIGAKSDTCEVQ